MKKMKETFSPFKFFCLEYCPVTVMSFPNPAVLLLYVAVMLLYVNLFKNRNEEKIFSL